MCRYVDYMEKTSDKLVRPGTTFGEWLSPEASMPKWATTQNAYLVALGTVKTGGKPWAGNSGVSPTDAVDGKAALG